MPAPRPKKPEASDTSNVTMKIVVWAVVVAIIGGIVWMIVTNPPEKKLVCKSSVQASLHSFGTCVEE